MKKRTDRGAWSKFGGPSLLAWAIALTNCSPTIEPYRLAPGASELEAAQFREGLHKWDPFLPSPLVEGDGGWTVEFVDQDRMPNETTAGVTCIEKGDPYEGSAWRCPRSKWIGLSHGNVDFIDPRFPAGVVGHEIGHSLGMPHAPEYPCALMSPTCQGDDVTPIDVALCKDEGPC